MTVLYLGLLALGVIALGFVFWPLLRKGNAAPLGQADHVRENLRSYQDYLDQLDQQLASGRITADEHAALKLEKERALLEDDASERAQAKIHEGRGAVVVIVAALILIAAGVLYWKLGAKNDVEIRQLVDQKRAQLMDDFENNRTPDNTLTRELIAKLNERLKSDPEHSQYWFLLARNHVELNEFAQAVTAYEKIIARDESSALVFSEAAQALFLQQQQTVSDKLVTYVDKALAIDPENSVALGLSGIIGFSQKNYQRSIDAWTRVLAQTGPDSPSGPQILAGIERARALLIESGGSVVSAPERVVPVKVSLSDKVVVPPNAVVLVYARAWQGSKMPLAITKMPLTQLPEIVNLSEAMAMSPAATLASAEQIEVVVRVSASGEAMPQSGDWEGTAGPFSVADLPRQVAVEVNTPL